VATLALFAVGATALLVLSALAVVAVVVTGAALAPGTISAIVGAVRAEPVLLVALPVVAVQVFAFGSRVADASVGAYVESGATNVEIDEQIPPNDRRLLRLGVSSTALVGLLLLVVAVLAPDAAPNAFRSLTVDRPWLPATLVVVGFGAVALLERRQADRLVSLIGASVADPGGPRDVPRLRRLASATAGRSASRRRRSRSPPPRPPQAFTVGYRPSSTTPVVSTGLLDALDDDELRAVVAHELAHVRNGDAALVTGLSLPVALADRIERLGSTSPDRLGRRGGIAHVSLPSAVAVSATLVGTAGVALLAALSRLREYSADRGAVAITGDPAGLASALGSIGETLSNDGVADPRTTPTVGMLSIVGRTTPGAGAVLLGPDADREFVREPPLADRLFATHPTIRDRVARLRKLERAQERR
jgi:heat shock protein HtpX